MSSVHPKASVLIYLLLKVGTISANGEKEIGELIAKAMEKVGKEGVITLAVSKNTLKVLSLMHSMSSLFIFK